MGGDALSDVLRGVRLTGAVYFHFELTSPWVAQAPLARAVAPVVMPGAEHVIEYHVVTEGACWGGLLDGERYRLEAGDVLAFPQGDPHILSSAPGLWAEPDMSLFRPATGVRLPFVHGGGGGGAERAQLVCGFLGCDLRPFNPLFATLPRVIHLRSRSGPGAGWLDRFIEFVLQETAQKRAGGENVLARLAEVMFVEMIRRYLDDVPTGQTGWLAGLRDRSVGRALAVLHARPAYPWTIEELAKEAGLSRSAFAERFTQFVGQPPIQYLARWRMQMAASMLAGGSDNLASVAAQVGYESEAAFNRAFKKMVGVAPGAWRRSREDLRSTTPGSGAALNAPS